MLPKSIRRSFDYLETGRGKTQCRTTDKILSIVLWLHLPVTLALAFYYGKSSLWFAAVATVAIAGPATLLYWLQPGHLATRTVVGVGFMAFSALLVHLSGGVIEYHFHFFVFLAVIASYRDVRVLLVATVFVAAHHVSFNYLLPQSLFYYGSNLGMVVLHALFVVLEVAYLTVDIQLKSKEFDFVETTRSVVEGVTTAAEDVLQSNRLLAQNAGEQAASVEQITSTVTELDGQAQKTVEAVRTARSHLRDVGQEADQGMRRVQQLVESMATLHDESSSMREMLSLIESIAFQTNLLSLNAAVEAARAGDSGRGFAVVAEEVRNLAARSGQSAQKIGEVVESALRRVKEGNESATQTRGVFEKIHDGIANSEAKLVDVSEVSEHMARGMAQISTALGQIDQFTQQTSAQAAGGTDTAALLKAQAGELATMLEGFTGADAGANGNGAARAPAVKQRRPRVLPEPRHERPRLQ